MYVFQNLNVVCSFKSHFQKHETSPEHHRRTLYYTLNTVRMKSCIRNVMLSTSVYHYCRNKNETHQTPICVQDNFPSPLQPIFMNLAHLRRAISCARDNIGHFYGDPPHISILRNCRQHSIKYLFTFYSLNQYTLIEVRKICFLPSYYFVVFRSYGSTSIIHIMVARPDLSFDDNPFVSIREKYFTVAHLFYLILMKRNDSLICVFYVKSLIIF